ncbi:biotin-dependent carboxyltransferase family protein [Flavobacteriaceae bacterium SZ-1-7]|uniref:biotin-dependent carboxyltransferase family protein n=1 Tax=Tamlana sedimenti TaxID=3134126 RepID=UPI00312990FB
MLRFTNWKARWLMVKVLNPGLYSTVQDMGRFGYQEYGVPYSGVMDRYAAKIVNALLSNDENAAVIEMTMKGATLQFECDAFICISGALMNPKLNDLPVKNNKIIAVKSGDILSFGKLELGFRCYLGVSGGFNTEMVMQSKSMFANITSSHILRKGDMLHIERVAIKNSSKHASVRINKSYLNTQTIEAFMGPEFYLLSEEQQNQLLTSQFTISKENNRMAYQLEETIENDIEPIITSPVIPGTVQLTPSGKLIVLMRDCQTTGGYPRILQLKESAIDVLSQKFTGKELCFDLEEQIF